MEEASVLRNEDGEPRGLAFYQVIRDGFGDVAMSRVDIHIADASGEMVHIGIVDNHWITIGDETRHFAWDKVETIEEDRQLHALQERLESLMNELFNENREGGHYDVIREIFEIYERLEPVEERA